MKVDHIYDAEDHLTPEGAANGTRVVPENTILFVVRGMILARDFPVAITRRSVAFNQDLKAVKSADFINTDFLYYWLKANAYEILGRVDEAGHGTKRIQTDRLLAMRVRVPSPSVQRRIAETLSAYDQLIENSQRRIRILEEMARSLYREWFVDFRFAGHEHARHVSSPLGQIPGGWGIRNVKDIAEVTYGFPFQSKLFNTEGRGTPLVRIRDIPTGSSETFTEEKAEPKYHIENGHILVGMDGEFHMCIWSSGHALQNQRVARFESHGEIGNYHLSLALERPIQALNKAIIGATVAHLGDMHIKMIQIVWPPANLLRTAREVLDPMLVQILSLKGRIANLRKTRDLLLPRLLSGASIPH